MGQGFTGAPWLMLSLKPERSAIMRIKPGGRSHGNFSTMGTNGTLLERWFVGIETSPVARTVIVMMIAIATPAAKSFHERITLYTTSEARSEFVELNQLDRRLTLKDRFAGFWVLTVED